MALRPYSELPFTNRLGHQIQVGETVVAIAQGYNHSVKMYLGEYIGRRGNCPIVKIKAKRNIYEKNTWKKLGEEEYFRFSNLPNGRIFPTSMPLTDLVGKRVI